MHSAEGAWQQNILQKQNILLKRFDRISCKTSHTAETWSVELRCIQKGLPTDQQCVCVGVWG